MTWNGGIKGAKEGENEREMTVLPMIIPACLMGLPTAKEKRSGGNGDGCGGNGGCGGCGAQK